LASSAEVRETTLQRDVDLFIKIVGCIAVGMGLLFFVIDIILGYTFSTNIVLMIGIVTGNIPEGLLITLTVTLALAAKRMADVKVLVKNMQSVETLGSTSCICSDKTGTLTQNRMTVSHMFYNAMIHEASVNYEEYRKNPNLDKTYDINDPGFKDLIQAIALGSKASFSYTPSPDELKTYIAKQEGRKAAAQGELTEA
jgi:sodium/potassium-transporting ATPase subunit alpha